MKKKSKSSSVKSVNEYIITCNACGNQHGISWGITPRWDGPCLLSTPKDPGFSHLSVIELPYILMARHGDMVGVEDSYRKYSQLLGKPLLVVSDVRDLKTSSQDLPAMSLSYTDLRGSTKPYQVANGFVMLGKNGWTLIKESEMITDAMWAHRLFDPKNGEDQAA